MATNSEKIQKLEKELKSLKDTLTKYGNLFNADGFVDTEEQKQIDDMQLVIKKIEAKLKLIKEKSATKEIPTADSNNCTPEKTKRIREQYEKMIANASVIGPVAADNLQRFINGVGGTKRIEVSWLRDFSAIQDAESRILGYTEGDKNLKKWVTGLKNGDKVNKSDYWDADIREYNMFSQLSYASGASDMRGDVSMKLTREQDVVSIEGTVDIKWSDRYDWNKGMSFYVPGSGTISDDDGIYLKRCGGAKDFDMLATWQFTYTGEYDAKSSKWLKSEWKIDGTVYTPTHSEIEVGTRD